MTSTILFEVHLQNPQKSRDSCFVKNSSDKKNIGDCAGIFSFMLELMTVFFLLRYEMCGVNTF